ncbi:MAG TPA: DUF3857 domain-containing protein, partial [Deltaproteobacteria bacterium]|nr:DUF3857 domain-containing protein [Deltaproteobacteria bacterium]
MTRHSASRLATLVALVLALACAPSIQAASWVPLDRDEVIRQARTVTLERYPDADVAVVDQQNWQEYTPDGTYVEWFEQYAKVLSEKGRRSYLTLHSSFNVIYNTTRFDLVEIISASGEVRRVDIERNSRVMVDSSQMEANIYDPNNKILQVSIPELAIGDTVHFITYDEFIKARMANEFSDFVTFEDTDPIVRSSYTVVAPAEKPLKSMALKNEIPGTITFLKTEQDRKVVYQWVARDIPRAFVEPAMPPLHTQAQRLLVSTIPDWQTVSRWYWNLSKPRLAANTSDMAAMVKKITRGKRTRKEKVEAIFFWVSQEVRYLGIVAESEAPGYEPHDVSMTFERRAGVCRDKAALLVAMMRLAGIEAYPVLIRNGPKMDVEVPQPYFNHAIACVKNPDGTYLLMDPTDENTKDLFPAYLNDQSYLVATPKGETLLTSPITPASRNMMKLSTTGSIDGQGTLNATTTMDFDGINDNAYRGYFSTLQTEERKIYFEKMLRKVIPSAALKDLAVHPDNVMDITAPLKAVMTFSAENFPVQGDGVTLIPVPRFGDHVGMVNFLIQKMGLKERKYTYLTETACGVEETMSLSIDPSLGSRLAGVVQEASIDDGALWIRSLDMSKGTLVAKNTFQLKRTEYSPDQYQALQETLRKVEKANRLMPALSGTPQAAAARDRPWYASFNPDAVIMEEDLEVSIEDASTLHETSRLRARVLTYAGRKKMGEIRISYNPVWEDVRLVSAAVTSPQGSVTRIDPREINIMDQEWVGAAPRYPAGKILVASLPNLQEGSIVEYEICKTRKDSQPFVITSFFQGEDPVERRRLVIRYPRSMKLKTVKADNGLAAEPSWKPFPPGLISEVRREEGDRTVVEYHAERIAPIRKEENLPPAYSWQPVVYASACELKDYARLVGDALEKASSGQEASSAKAALLTRDLADEAARIRAIRDYIARNIKAVPVSLTALPLSQISRADITLSEGYGHRADCMVLLAAMLRAIGHEPEFLLTSTASPVVSLQGPLRDYPGDAWFTGVLVKITTARGDVFLGDTDQYAELGSTANLGNPALNLATGAIEVVTTPEKGLADRTDYAITVTLGKGGDAVIRQRRTFSGLDYA